MLGPAKAAIRSFIEQGFTATPLIWPNERIDTAEPPARFVAVEVQGVTNEIRGVGDDGHRLFIHPGIIIAHVFTEFGEGEAAADAIADELSSLLSWQQVDAPAAPQIVRTHSPTVHDGELNSENGNYWRVTVSVPFDFYYFA